MKARGHRCDFEGVCAMAKKMPYELEQHLPADFYYHDHQDIGSTIPIVSIDEAALPFSSEGGGEQDPKQESSKET